MTNKNKILIFIKNNNKKKNKSIMFKGIKTTLSVVGLVIMGSMVSCGVSESENCEEKCDSTTTDTCVTTTDSLTVSDACVEADTAQ